MSQTSRSTPQAPGQPLVVGRLALLLIVAAVVLSSIASRATSPSIAIAPPPAIIPVPGPTTTVDRFDQPDRPSRRPRQSVPGRAPTALPDRPTWQSLRTEYDLSVDVDMGRGTAEVRELIRIRNDATRVVPAIDLSVLAAAFDEVRISEVTIDGRRVPATWSNDANLHLELARPLAVGAAMTIEVRFTVQPTDDTSSSLAIRTSNADGVLRFGHFFPIVSNGHGLRWPGDSQVTAMADRIRLDLAVAEGVVAAVPGRLVSAAGGRLTYELTDARDLAFSMSRAYVHTVERVDDVAIEVFTLPGTSARIAHQAAARALRTFEAAYGPYPYERFVLAQGPRTRSGNEYSGIVFLGREAIVDELTIAHETAHQWFYGLVGNDQLAEPWVDEALAEFSVQHFFGRLEASCSTRPVDSPVSAFPNERAREDCDQYNETVYRRGAELVGRVHTHLGDEGFFATMRLFVREHAGSIVTGADLIDAWLAASPSPERLEDELAPYLAGMTQHEKS